MKRDGEEVFKILTTYVSTACARQILGDMIRSRVGQDRPEFKQVFIEAAQWADAHIPYTYKKE